MTTKTRVQCGLKMRVAKYAAGSEAEECRGGADSQAKCEICGWSSPRRCARHAKSALAKHNTTKHAQMKLPYAEPQTPRDDL